MNRSWFFKPFFLLLLVLNLGFLWSCSKTHHLARVEPVNYAVNKDSGISKDSSIEAVILPYRQSLNDKMNTVIGYAARTLEKGFPESTLGNWVGDLLHQKAEQYYGHTVNFALANSGGLRISSIPQGEITVGLIYELMPFDNMLVVMEMDSILVQQLFDHMAAKGGWPISRQVHFEIVNGKAQNIRINGKALDQKETYVVALPDYIANGGDDTFFLKNHPQKNLNILIRDLMLEYVEENWAAGKKMNAIIQSRAESK